MRLRFAPGNFGCQTTGILSNLGVLVSRDKPQRGSFGTCAAILCKGGCREYRLRRSQPNSGDVLQLFSAVERA
ncbi:hypothetical protein B0H12DRAFT_1103104, partial [Mycena haematopus]